VTRRPWFIVARREFVERARDKGFAVSTAITLLILVGFVVIGGLLGGETRFDLGVVGAGSETIADRTVAAAAALDIEVTLRTFDDREAAERAVEEGGVDAVLIDGERILVQSDPDDRLVGLVQAASTLTRTERGLQDAGLTEEQIRSIVAQAPLPVDALEPVDARQRENSTIAYVGVLALYGQLFAYGYWVAAGVIEEKASRIVEVLLATVRPSELLRGKILGIGLLGLGQLVLIGVVGMVAAQLVGSLEFPAGALSTIGIVLLWFVLGYFFYAGLFAATGAIVTRQEDLQTTMTPLTIVIVAGLFIGISAIGDPSSTLATVASFVPPTAPLVMPSRIVLGEAGLGAATLSIAIIVGATIALVPIATKVYSRAVLQTGRVRLRQVLRA
jgi:ABC-2 type transport system permease protein